MGLSGNFSGLRALKRSLRDLTNPNGRAGKNIGKGVAREIDGVLREEFATGEGPDGRWQQTKRGRPALVSRKLPQAFRSRFDRGVLRYVARTPRNWLEAHHRGHTFAARKVAALKQFLSFNSKGKLVAARRIFNQRGELRRGAFQRFAAAHEIRERKLPARPIYPTGALPSKWSNAISRGANAGMQKWRDRALE